LLCDCRIDTVVCASPSLVHWLVPLWAGVPLRASVIPNYGGNSYRRARRFLTHGEEHRAGRLLLETEFALLRRLGLSPADSNKEGWVAPDAASRAQELLTGVSGPLIGIGVSSGNKLKELGEEKLVSLASRLAEHAAIVLIGGPADIPLAARVCARLAAIGHSHVVDASGRLDLARLPALLARLGAYVGVDSGVTYLADAVGTPVVDLMGPADADDQRPTGHRAVVLRTVLPCAPCSHAFSSPYTCRLGAPVCVQDANIDAIVEAALAQLPPE
jgi:ADP-heptose:LPS heptosyltransferase